MAFHWGAFRVYYTYQRLIADIVNIKNGDFDLK